MASRIIMCESNTSTTCLKYLPMNATETQASEQWKEAEQQIKGYAQGPVVKAMAEGTELHLVIAQIKGYDLLRLDEVQ